MTQNIYDTAPFFAAYSQLPRSLHGLDGAPEWPAIAAMLPATSGARVLDLGCGFGWFCRWVRGQGASQVTGIDISENMLARARSTGGPDTGIAYRRADLETLDLATLGLPAASVDLAYSSLALHYVADLSRLFGEIHRALVPRGSLVFSVEHPVMTAPKRQYWTADADGHRSWPLDSYQSEGERIRDWLAPGVIKQHRMLATYLDLLIGNGLVIARVVEWGPSEAQVAADPTLAVERERPAFLMIAATR